MSCDSRCNANYSFDLQVVLKLSTIKDVRNDGMEGSSQCEQVDAWVVAMADVSIKLH